MPIERRLVARRRSRARRGTSRTRSRTASHRGGSSPCRSAPRRRSAWPGAPSRRARSPSRSSISASLFGALMQAVVAVATAAGRCRRRRSRRAASCRRCRPCRHPRAAVDLGRDRGSSFVVQRAAGVVLRLRREDLLDERLRVGGLVLRDGDQRALERARTSPRRLERAIAAVDRRERGARLLELGRRFASRRARSASCSATSRAQLGARLRLGARRCSASRAGAGLPCRRRTSAIARFALAIVGCGLLRLLRSGRRVDQRAAWLPCGACRRRSCSTRPARSFSACASAVVRRARIA